MMLEPVGEELLEGLAIVRYREPLVAFSEGLRKLIGDLLTRQAIETLPGPPLPADAREAYRCAPSSIGSLIDTTFARTAFF